MNTADNCKQMHEEGSDTSGKQATKCIGGTIATLIALAIEGKKSGILLYEIAKGTSMWAIDLSITTAVGKFVGRNAGFYGPFARTRHDMAQNVKRTDEHPVKQLEDHFSSKLGTEVRHIGFWDGSVLGASEVARRDQSQNGTIPTFALNLRSQEHHFAFTGTNSQGDVSLKLGCGIGPSTKENQRRMKARYLDPEDATLFNNNLFDRGGFDMIVEANSDNGHAAEHDVSSNQFGFAWIIEQIMCIVRPDGG